jgi:hypothetical protein
MSETETRRRRLMWGRVALAVAIVAMLTGAIFGWIARLQ